MKPNDLIGKVFDMPLFHAQMQQYKVKAVVEVTNMPGGWEIRLEWIPSSYSVPEELIIKMNRVVNGKMAITLNEITKSKNEARLKHIERKQTQIATMGGFREALIDLSTF